jgi:hypothetical protein
VTVSLFEKITVQLRFLYAVSQAADSVFAQMNHAVSRGRRIRTKFHFKGKFDSELLLIRTKLYTAGFIFPVTVGIFLFSTDPDWLWSSFSLLQKGFWGLFLRDKTTRAWSRVPRSVKHGPLPSSLFFTSCSIYCI